MSEWPAWGPRLDELLPRIQGLTKRLETQNDVSLKEADWMFYTYQGYGMSDRVRKSITPAIKDWYDTVAQKIKAGFSGNFIFSIPYILPNPPEYPYYIYCPVPEEVKEAFIEALLTYGKWEDRIYAVKANARGFSLFPKYLQGLFQETDEYTHAKYGVIAFARRAGFFRAPWYNSAGVKFNSLLEFLQKKLPAPILTTRESIIDYNPHFALDYLYENIPIIEVRAKKWDDYKSWGETVFFTDEKNLAIAKELLNIPNSEIAQYLYRNGFIDANTASLFLEYDNIFETELSEAGWDACKEYIEKRAAEFKKRMKMKKEWETTRNIVEDEDIWLDVIR